MIDKHNVYMYHHNPWCGIYWEICSGGPGVQSAPMETFISYHQLPAMLVVKTEPSHEAGAHRVLSLEPSQSSVRL